MNAGTMGDGSGLARTAPPSKICSDCKRKQTDSAAIRVAALWEPQGEGTRY